MRDKNQYLVVGLLLLFMLGAFLLRVLPVFTLAGDDTRLFYDSDTYYNLRQIELMVNAFPQYPWFDPMTAFPTGKVIDWGPLFPMLAAALCILTGATARESLVPVAMLVVPLLAACMVPVTYLLATRLWNNRGAGLVAAGLIPVISLHYFTQTYYGIVDHHAAEVVFSSLFVLAYIATLGEDCRTPVASRENSRFIGFCVLSGICFFLALAVMPTVLLFAAIVAAFTFIQAIPGVSRDRFFDRIVVLNTVCFVTAAVLYLVLLMQNTTLSVSTYSFGPAAALLALVAGTLAVYALTRIFGANRTGFGLALGGLCCAGLILLLINPPFIAPFRNAALIMLSQQTTWSTVLEMQPWTWEVAWSSYNGLLLVSGAGLILLVLSVLFERDRPEQVFLLVWTVAVLFLTLQHRRFEIYLPVIAALLSAYCILRCYRYLPLDSIRNSLGPLAPVQPEDPALPGDGTTVPEKKRKNRGSSRTSPAGSGRSLATAYRIGAVVLIVLVVPVSLVLSVAQDYSVVSELHDHQKIPAAWMEITGWLGNRTPPVGVDYYQVYSTPFVYPGDAYGIIANWDKGHWVTFFSRRIPVTNPFQDNLAGNQGVAAFYASSNESSANAILSRLGGRYIVTDTKLEIMSIFNLLKWRDAETDENAYHKWFLMQDPADPSHYRMNWFYDNDYYQTMIVRLHQFDGSLTLPSEVSLLEYQVRSMPAPGLTSEYSGDAPVIRTRTVLTGAEAENARNTSKEGMDGRNGIILLSDRADRPVEPVDALRHYRLVHESPYYAYLTPVLDGGSYEDRNTSYAKVFEYVPGARIEGDGIIEVGLVTNTGRTFTYRQASSSHEFVVPYATSGTNGDITATGRYHIVGTDRYFAVTEADIMNGSVIR